MIFTDYQGTLSTATIYFVVVISCQRYKAITHPIKVIYKVCNSGQRVHYWYLIVNQQMFEIGHTESIR